MNTEKLQNCNTLNNYRISSRRALRETFSVLLELLYIATAILFFAFPTVTAQAASVACNALKNVVLRSLFPMMVISRLIAYSGLFRRLSSAVTKSRLWKRLSLSDCLLPVILSALTSGLPAAARDTEILLESGRITEREAAKAVAAASLPSPAFVILAASDNALQGVVRYVLLAVTALTVCSFIKSDSSEGGVTGTVMTFPQAMSVSAFSALSVSANIVFFSAVTCLVSHLAPKLQGITAAFFEMGSGIVFAGESRLLQCIVLGWCGLSALSQIRTEAPRVSVKPYLAARCVSVAVLVTAEMLANCL